MEHHYDYVLHEKVWMPQSVKKQAMRLQRKLSKKYFTQHLYEHLTNKDSKHDYTLQDIKNVVYKISKNPISPFEVGIVEDEFGKFLVKKYCVRTNLNKQNDISIVLSNKGRIITAWINDVRDIHYTLDRSKYYNPNERN